MHAIEISAPGGPDVLRLCERPDPQPKDDDVLIRVAAAGVNRPDLMQRAGRYPPPAGASDLPGLEVAGEVVAYGRNAQRWKIGDKVMALVNGGGYATLCAVPWGQCLPWPEKLSAIEAAALPETLFTVYANVFDIAHAAPGESILIHGGASGIGTMGIQLCKAAGVTSYVTVGDAAKIEPCRALGARAVINYRTEDFVLEILKLTEGKGVDIVLDMVGGEYVARNLRCLAPQGRHVSIATQKGGDATIDIMRILQKRLHVTGSTLRPRSSAEKAKLAAGIEAKVWPLLDNGDVKPLIYKIFKLTEAAEAHRALEAGQHIGKIVLDCAGVSG